MDVKKSKTLYNLHKPENLKKGRKKISKISGALPFSARTGQKVKAIAWIPRCQKKSPIHMKSMIFPLTLSHLKTNDPARVSVMALAKD